jgi:heat shock protein HslJ
MKSNRVFGILAAVAVIIPLSDGAAQEAGFPYDRELLLDVRPMPGSKRIPNLEIASKGAIILEMWCNRVEGQVVVAGDTVTIITGQPTIRACPPERTRAETELLEALSGVTNWSRQGDAVELIGPTTLRFKLPTN